MTAAQLVEMLGQLLVSLSSQDNKARKEAEKQLDEHWVVHQLASLLAGLAHLTASHPDAHIRTFAAILLRRYALKSVGTGSNTTLLEQAGGEALIEIQKMLIQSLNSETEIAVRTKVADTASQLAKLVIEKKGTWTELFQSCVAFLSSPNQVLRRTTFMLLTGCPQMMMKQDQNSVKSMFVSGIQDGDVDVRLAALSASVQYLCICKSSTRNELSDLLPLILNVIPSVISDSSREENAVDGLTTIIDLAASYPKLFKQVLPQTVEFMISQMKNTDLEDGTRQTCLELLLTLCEGAPGLMRKYQPFAPAVIPIVLEWMSELEDEQEWYQGETIEDENESSNETAGEQAMDRLAIYLGGNIVLPIAFSLIPTMLAAPEWNKRHAALRCISAIGEGCHKIMEAELGKVVQVILPHMRDAHPRVRHAACNAIGQMCTDFSPKMQNQFHAEILSHLIPIMDDIQTIRVANYASAALVNFSENASKDLIAPYIETIIEKLLVLLNTGKLFVQEQAITTLATVADSAGPEFVKFYGRIMQVLLQILQFPNQKEYRNLKGKTLECSSLIILAVGKETFAQDAAGFINVLQTIQTSITDSDDPQSSYLLSAWARVCKVLGTDFAPYLNIVLPPLLKTAAIQPKMVAFEAEEDIGDEYNEEEGWELMAVGDKNLAIKTSILEDKCTAVEMLLCYAQEMGGMFHTYVEEIVKMVLPMLKFYLNDGVRYAAASVIPVLLQCWIKANYPKEKIDQLWSVICVSLMDAIVEEEDLSLLCTFYNTLCDGIKNVGTTSMTTEHMQRLTTHLLEQLEQYLIRNKERQRQREAEDYDPEDEDALQDEEFNDDTFLGDASATVSALFTTYKSDFLPFFDQLLPKINEFATCQDPSSRQWALCVFCDLIEYTGPSSVAYQGYFLQFMASSLADPSADVRQAAAYGAGVAAKFGGPSFSSFILASVPHLFTIINAPESRNEENVMATENSISAIGKIIRAYSNAGLDGSTIPLWIGALPILEDAEEAPETYRTLIELLNHPSVGTPELAPKLVSIITQVLAVPTLMPKNPEISTDLLAALQSILSKSDKQLIWGTLNSEQQQFLVKHSLI